MSAGEATQRSAGPGRGPWAIADPRDAGLNPQALDQAAQALAARGERQGLVIVLHGRIVFERYWANDYHRATPDWKNVSFSSGKSWGSAMIGRAITQGLLRLDDLAATYHPPARSGLKPETTIRHLLTMTSGGTLCVKPSTRRPKRLGDASPPEPGDEYVWTKVGERGSPEGYGQTIPAGAQFYYDGAAADHLANVIHGASGQPSLDFMMERIVAPLGCENFEYQPEGIDKSRNVRIGGSILMSCRDLARLGQLFLNRGDWSGERLIDAAYVDAALSPSPLNPSYGFLWWLNGAGRIPNAPRELVYAAGARGQFCFVLPSRACIIATMGFGAEQTSGEEAWQALGPIFAS